MLARQLHRERDKYIYVERAKEENSKGKEQQTLTICLISPKWHLTWGIAYAAQRHVVIDGRDDPLEGPTAAVPLTAVSA